MKKRTRIVVGYIFVLFGIFMPLLAFTIMSYREISADREYRSFKEKLPKLTESIKSYNDSIKSVNTSIIDPFENEDYIGSYPIEGLDTDEVFAYLIIPKLDLKKPIYLDASSKHLNLGVAQIEGTSLPLGGKSTRSVLAGHRGYWEDFMFYRVDELEAGDSIFIDGRTGLLKYEVVDKEIINPSEWDKILPIEGKDILTLLTCHPKRPPRPKRLLINAKRVLEEKETKNSHEKITKEDIKNFNYLKYITYIITIIGWIFMVFFIFKLIKFLKA
ncbi:sortase family protein [Clostridiales bacterium KA00134]|nr:sortase family protein [Clostridiales bacterium KA00134]